MEILETMNRQICGADQRGGVQTKGAGLLRQPHRPLRRPPHHLALTPSPATSSSYPRLENQIIVSHA